MTIELNEEYPKRTENVIDMEKIKHLQDVIAI